MLSLSSRPCGTALEGPEAFELIQEGNSRLAARLVTPETASYLPCAGRAAGPPNDPGNMGLSAEAKSRNPELDEADGKIASLATCARLRVCDPEVKKQGK